MKLFKNTAWALDTGRPVLKHQLFSFWLCYHKLFGLSKLYFFIHRIILTPVSWSFHRISAITYSGSQHVLRVSCYYFPQSPGNWDLTVFAVGLNSFTIAFFQKFSEIFQMLVTAFKMLLNGYKCKRRNIGLKTRQK